MEKKQSNFSGQIGFVLAAAGSAVGVGNLWRFPYLAAKDGGGLFLLVYLVLVLTFGFTLLTSDIAIGRRTKQSAIRAYETMRPKWKFLGILTFLVPVLIMTYYAVIGGWITKYAVVYLTGQSAAAAEDGYFTSFITSPVSPVVFALLFMGVTAFIVYNGVEGGIERVSRYMMPILLVLVVVIAGYALTLRFGAWGPPLGVSVGLWCNAALLWIGPSRGVSLRLPLRSLAVQLAGTALTFGSAYGVVLWAGHASNIAQLALAIPAGAAVYAASLLIGDRNWFRLLKKR